MPSVLQQITLEACTETLAQTLEAEKKGATRIELCGDLSVGGVTPPKELILEVLKQSKLLIKVMIRPRGGNFVYSESELQQMKKDILWCKEKGVQEVVFGILNAANQIDIKNTKELAALAYPMDVTFHKAIDETPDIYAALDALKNLPEVTSILTSGQAATAEEGKTLLKKMLAHCEDKLTLIVAGKVTGDNLAFLRDEIGGLEFHGRCIV